MSDFQVSSDSPTAALHYHRGHNQHHRTLQSQRLPTQAPATGASAQASDPDRGLPQQSFMKLALDSYTIFAHNQAMSSNLLLHQVDPIAVPTFGADGATHGDANASTAEFLPNMYGLNEFEFTNGSFESLPAASDKLYLQFDLVDNPDWYSCPYTPTFNENYLSNFSEASFTSQSELADTMSGSMTPSHALPMTKRSLTGHVHSLAHTHAQVQHAVAQSPHATAPYVYQALNPTSVQHQHQHQLPHQHQHQHQHRPLQQSCFANHGGMDLPLTAANSSPTAHLPKLHSSANQNLYHATAAAATLASGSGGAGAPAQQTPMYFPSPSTASSVSPNPTTLKGMSEGLILPPQNAFRQNSDSSFNFTASSIDTPRRHPAPPGFGYFPNNSATNFDLTPPVYNPHKSLSKKLLVSSLSDETKPKKYTRKRLLPRSKNGCWTCRIKHLKCDEVRPVCNSCLRFGIECDYSPEKPPYVADKNLRMEKLASIAQAKNRKGSPTEALIKKKRSKAKLLG